MHQPINNNTVQTNKNINGKEIQTKFRTAEINQHINK